ncbi:MAG: energy transducer TonB [Phormidesmis sp.]
MAPRANFSFAALTEAAQQQEAEETIVPLVELTPAERNRLPGFAQPRQLQPTPTGLGSLALPSGLPGLSNIPPRSISPSTARRIPSPTPQTQTTRQQQLDNIRRASQAPPGFDPSRITTRTVPLPPVDFFTPSQSAELTIDPEAAAAQGQSDGQNPGSAGTAQPNPGGSAEDLGRQQVTGDLLASILAEQNSQATGNDSNGTDSEGGAVESPETPVQGTDIAVQAEPVEPAPAQGNPTRLLNGFTYDPRDVDEAAAAENLETWLAESTENKGEVDSETVELTVDSQFKVCKEVEPSNGLIGVIVNPDGTQENATVLKSIGYDVLNRQALTAIENEDFGQPEQTTLYQVAINVIYEPEGCVDTLPEAG